MQSETNSIRMERPLTRSLEPQVLPRSTLLTSAKSSNSRITTRPQLLDTDYLKFSAVLGTTSALRVNSIRPAGLPPMAISKYTTGLDILLHFELIALRDSANLCR